MGNCLLLFRSFSAACFAPELCFSPDSEFFPAHTQPAITDCASFSDILNTKLEDSDAFASFYPFTQAYPSIMRPMDIIRREAPLGDQSKLAPKETRMSSMVTARNV